MVVGDHVPIVVQIHLVLMCVLVELGGAWLVTDVAAMVSFVLNKQSQQYNYYSLICVQISMNVPMARNSVSKTVRILQAPTPAAAGLDTAWAVMVEVAVV